MAEVVLDANVLVALLYEADVHRPRAESLLNRLDTQGHAIVLLDFLVLEAVSVSCRRARERKAAPPDLIVVLDTVQFWFSAGYVRLELARIGASIGDVLEVIRESKGVLNVNDAFVVVLARSGVIESFATFDPGFDSVEGAPRFE